MQIYTRNNKNQLCYSADFFQHYMSKALSDPELKVISAVLDENAYDTETAHVKYAEEQKRLLGLFRYAVTYQSLNNDKTVSILVKSKRSAREFIYDLLGPILLKSGVKLKLDDLCTMLAHGPKQNTDIKEIEIYQLALKDSRLAAFLPINYGTYIDAANEEYIIFEEYLSNAYLMHDYQDLSFWNQERIIQALQDLSKFHALYFNNYQALCERIQLGAINNTATMQHHMPLWQAYAENLKSYIGTLFSNADFDEHLRMIDTLASWYPKIDALPKTLIYNDLQVRNIAIRNDGRLCLFDWEVATIQIPQRDTVEFICYLMQDHMTDDNLADYLEISRLTLSQASGLSIPDDQWLQGCLYALYDYQIDRLALQLCLHKVIQRPDIERVYHASQRLKKYLIQCLSNTL